MVYSVNTDDHQFSFRLLGVLIHILYYGFYNRNEIAEIDIIFTIP